MSADRQHGDVGIITTDFGKARGACNHACSALSCRARLQAHAAVQASNTLLEFRASPQTVNDLNMKIRASFMNLSKLISSQLPFPGLWNVGKADSRAGLRSCIGGAQVCPTVKKTTCLACQAKWTAYSGRNRRD